MKCSVNCSYNACNFSLYFCLFSSVFVLVYASTVPVEEDIIGNSTLLSDDDDSFEKRTEKRSSSLHPIPSSSSLLLKDEDLSMMDRIQIPIIYHTSLSGKSGGYSSFKSDLNPHNYILNSRPNMKPLRKPSGNHHGFPGPQHQSLLSNQGPQVFPLQNPYPPVIQHSPYNTYSSQSYSPPHFSSSSTSSQVAPSSDPMSKHPDLLYYQNFDKLCPASKPYPVYIEKKVPITIEKRVPYPVKVPYPVHHYHYDNVEHRNVNAEDLKDGTPPPPVKDSKPPPKVGGLFTAGDKGGYKGDTKEEMYDAYDENNGGEKHDDEYESYDHYEKSGSREIPRNVPRTVSIPRTAKPPPSRNVSTRNNNNKNSTRTNRNNNRINKRNNSGQQGKKNTENRASNERRFERDGSVIIKTEMNNEENKTVERVVLPQATTTVVGLRSETSRKNNDE